MYAGYFGLTQAPFSIAPDPRYLFMSERHREALAHLLYGLEGGGGFVLLTGEIGTGKTTIARSFLQQMPPHCSVAYIFNPKLSATELLQTICHEFQVPLPTTDAPSPSIRDLIDPLNAYLLQSHAAGRHNILVIDEAQNLSADVLEQLRLLTNLETSERKLLQIVLIGQPELRQLLARPELEQLAQRVIARFHLGALTAPETSAYIQHRMGVAGFQGPLPFDDAALRRIHALTGGVPRRINLLCDRALLGAYARGLPQVTQAVVKQAASEVFDAPTAPPWSARWRLAPLALGAAGGAALAATAFYISGAMDLPPVARPSSAPVSANPAPVPATPASIAASPAALPAAAPEALSVGPLPALNNLLRSEASALRELGVRWDQVLTGDDPCASALRAQLQCFRTTRMTLHGLRQLDRPAVLTLQLRGQAPGWVLLASMDSDTATLQAGAQRWRVPLTVLADAWRGDYATLWQLPPGQSGALRRAQSGPVAQWVARQLQALQPGSALPDTPASFKAAVAAFQRSQGLDDDGIPGVMTLMQINRRSGVPEPRLATAQP
jgi:general secretion pathway protein A